MENKIKNLQVGQIFKSYRQLAEFLDEKVKTGNSKNSQIKNWKCYFNYHKDGNKFIIDEVYDEPLEKEDNRGRKSIYVDTIQLLILDMLGYKNGKITISKRKLIESLGIANANYYGCYQNLVKLSQYLNMDIDYIYDFYNVNNNNFSSIIRTSLESLENKRVINCNRIKKVKLFTNQSTTIATDLEVEIILKYEKEALISLGYTDMLSIRKSKDWKKFSPLVEDKLHANTNIDYYFNAYEIIINKDFVDYEKENLVSLILSKISRENTKKELNQLIIENGIINAKHRSIEDNGSKRMSKIRRSDTYVDNFQVLNNKLVNINYNSIVDEVVNYTPYGLSQDMLDEINSLF